MLPEKFFEEIVAALAKGQQSNLHYAIAGGPRRPKERGMEELKLLVASDNCRVNEKEMENLILLSEIKGHSTTRSSHGH